MKSIARMWKEESGVILSAEIMLVSSILVIGAIVGLKSLRDSVVTELADVAQAFANVDQSYSYSGVVGHHAFTGGGAFFDTVDFCDLAGNHPFQASKCVTICASLVHPFGPGSDGGADFGFGVPTGTGFVGGRGTGGTVVVDRGLGHVRRGVVPTDHPHPVHPSHGHHPVPSDLPVPTDQP